MHPCLASTLVITAVSLGALGCGPGTASASEETGSANESGTSTTATGTMGETSAGTTETGAPETTETGEPGPSCGDGIVDPGEVCDGPPHPNADCIDCAVVVWPCGAGVYDCGDSLDNDDDGLIDDEDPDCLSPCDRSEDRLSPSQIGGNADGTKSDCYWDTTNGPGDDKCEHHYDCDPEGPLEPWQPYDPDAPWCGEPLEPECLELCLPRVPNGCDCFGCCVVDGQNVFLGLQIDDPNGGCSAATLDQCNSCTIVPECFNPCEPEACELCLLDAPEDLAPGCTEPSCPDGVDSCMGPFDCGEGQHCSGGCCLDYGSF